MQYKKKGEIAVFLAMLVGVISVFTVTLIRQVRRNVEKSEIVMAMDAAIRSCFAEYNQRLYEEYDIICIDSSYKTDIASSQELINHFTVYMKENLLNTSVYDLGRLEISDVNLIDVKVIADEEEDYLEVLREADKIEELLKERYGDGSFDGRIFTTDKRRCRRQRSRIDKSDDLKKIDEQGETEDAVIEIVISDAEIFELVDEDMQMNGSPGFRISDCIIYFEIGVHVTDGDGNDFDISRSYGY